MSHVINVLLSHDILEDGRCCDPHDLAVPVQQLNALLGDRGQFTRLDPYAGGSKCMEATVYGAAFNYFGDLAELAPLLVKVPWKHPDHLQLLIQGQDESAFTFYPWPRIAAAARPALGEPSGEPVPQESLLEESYPQNHRLFSEHYGVHQPVDRRTHVVNFNMNLAGLSYIARDIRLVWEVPDAWLLSRPWSEVEHLMHSLVSGVRLVFSGAEREAWCETRDKLIRQAREKMRRIEAEWLDVHR